MSERLKYLIEYEIMCHWINKTGLGNFIKLVTLCKKRDSSEQLELRKM